MSAKIYRIRRAIVKALYDYHAPQDLDTVSCHPAVMAENLSPDMLRVEWDNLAAIGVIETLPGYRGKVAKLVPRVRQSMELTGMPPQIEALWGAEVL